MTSSMRRLSQMAKPTTFPPINRKDGMWLIGLVIGLAWLALWLGHHNHSDYPFMSLSATNPADMSLLVAFSGWELMLVAMMLPTMIPMFSLFSRMIQHRPHRAILRTLLILGYLTPWTLSGLAFIAMFKEAHSIVNQSSAIHPLSWLLGPTILIAAGLYQFSSMKYACLQQCRSPLSFVLKYWQGRNERQEAYRLGIGHGLFCMGCCWLLMLTMSITGLNHLGWMLGFGTAMAIEKNLPKGSLIRKPLGMTLITWGMILVVNGLAFGSR